MGGNVSKWVSVSEELPKIFGNYLVTTGYGDYEICRYDSNGWANLFISRLITHWLLIPLPPKI